MNRRAFIVFAGGAFAWPLAARAQKSDVPVIGFLNPASPADWAPRVAAFREGLAKAGYTEGRNVAIEFHWAERQYGRLPALAADLVQRRVAVIVATGGTVSVLAAKAATAAIPIVFTLGNDPVELGLVASLNRPGGNVTGVSILSRELTAKRLELLHELVPDATVVAMLVNPDNARLIGPEATAAQEAARGLGVRVNPVRARSEREVDEAFSELVRRGARALLVGSDPLFEAWQDRLIALAALHAVPTVYAQRQFVMSGGLASYSANINDAYRQAGTYVAKILDGAKPAELPVLRPTSVELIINLGTAKALGLSVPQSLLLRADEVIR